MICSFENLVESFKHVIPIKLIVKFYNSVGLIQPAPIIVKCVEKVTVICTNRCYFLWRRSTRLYCFVSTLWIFWCIWKSLWVLYLFEMQYKKQLHFIFLSHFKIQSHPYSKEISTFRGTWQFALSDLILINAFQGEFIILCLHTWKDSKVSLAWIKAFNKEFQTLFRNRVVKIRKNILLENRSYSLKKVNPSDLIARLDKNIDLSKRSLWWRDPRLINFFEKNQSYAENDYCKNKKMLSDSFTGQFERKIKNEVTTSKVEHLRLIT